MPVFAQQQGNSYDADSHLTGLTHALPNGAYNITLGTFTYNPAHQILTRPSSNTTYDFAGYSNGEAWTSTANGLNEDATIAAISGGYDGNGNETNDGTRTFTYDVENRLTGVSIPSTATTVALSYDPTGRLTQEVATVSGTATTTQFLYAGDKLVAEYQGAMTNRYVHGAGTDEPVVWYPGATTSVRNFLHADNQGSVIAYSNGSGGATAYQYGAYGEPNAWSGGRFRYTGQIMLPEVKLYYYKARVYDPIAGRFLQTDPIGYKDNLDLYEYVGDDPVDNADPVGTDCIPCDVGRMPGQEWSAQDQQNWNANAPARNAYFAVASLFVPVGAALEVPAAGRTFWSGGQAAMHAAANWTARHGGTTLEQTVTGKALTLLTKVAGYKNTQGLWKAASASFAKGADGEVHVFLGAKVNPEGIWNTVEKDILGKGGNNIVEHSAAPAQSAVAPSAGKPSLSSFPKAPTSPESCQHPPFCM